jgi:GT2 family glycosyltransferase
LKSVTVIIVNWNGKKFVAKCLDGLRKQTYKNFSVIMVDNGSNDGSAEFVSKKYPEVEIEALSENLGFSIANNIAVESVETEYVVLLNNDAVPHPNWLENLLNAIKDHPEAGFAASKMLFFDNPTTIDRTGDIYTTGGTALLRGRGQLSDNYTDREWVFGACAGAALYKTRMLKDVGLFDEDFFLVYEDVDLSFRAQLRGFKCLYVPDAIVYHLASSSIVDDSSISVYYSHRNLEWVYIQNMPDSLIKKTILPHLIYDMAAFFFFTAKGRSIEFIKAKWHAIKGFRRSIDKRSRIQARKKVTDEYIWSILEKERLLPRLTRRLLK